MEINLDDYTAGGYFVTRYVSREVWMNPDLMPEKIISVSGCISTMCQVAWKWAGIQPEEARTLGIPPERWNAFTGWCNTSQGVDIGYPDTFYTLEAARRAVDTFFPSDNDLIIIGINMHNKRVNDFLDKHKLSGNQYGVYETLSQHNLARSGGEICGFDVSGYGEGINHSWLCFNFEDALDEKFDIQANSCGLMSTPNDAQRLTDYANQKESRWNWESWMVIQYPVKE